MDWEREDGAWGYMEILNEYVRDPPALRSVVRGHDSEHADDADMYGDSDWELIKVAGVTYMRIGEGDWTTYAMSPDEEIDPPDLGIFELWLRGDRGRLVGTETVDGMRARRYHLDKGDLDYLQEDMEELLSAEFDVWVSTEYDVVIKALMTMVGIDEGMQSSAKLELTAIDINKPIAILAPELDEAPPKFEVPAAHEELPMMPEARISMILVNSVWYEVDATLEEVASFFRSELPEHGWTEVRSLDDSRMHYEKDGMQARITIVELDDGTCNITVHIDAD